MFAASAVLLSAPLALAAPATYTAKLDPTNSSGVAAVLTFTLHNTLLTANLNATGLADGLHLLRIHGKDSAPGVPVNTIPLPLPVPPNGDLNKDGVLNTPEAKAGVGLVILSLVQHAPGTAAELIGVTSASGTLNYSASFDLSQDLFEPGFKIADLLPVDFRVLNLHGGIVPLTSTPDGGITGRPGTFDPNLPVASGKIQAGPEPAPIALLRLGLFTLAGLRRSRV